MGRRRRPAPARDQLWSPFARILQNLIDATPGALGAVLVDDYGECVDYAGVLDPYDIKIAGAHMQLELRLAGDRLESAMGRPMQLIVRARKKSFVVRNLLDGYTIAVVLGRCAGFGISERAIAQAEFDLRAEAGWDPPRGQVRWVHAVVETLPG